jgi:hypothetical protein
MSINLANQTTIWNESYKVDIWILIIFLSLNIVFLSIIYLINKYQYRFLINEKNN